MKKKFSLLGKHLLALTLVFFFSKATFSQKIKTTSNSKNSKGHQLYKQTKIYDNSKKAGSESKPRPVGDRAKDRATLEFEMLKNPLTGEIPENIKVLEAKFSKSIKETKELKNNVAKKRGRYSYWKSRGPYNVGGRTRALAIDRYNENIIFAGGVSGGLWRSSNGGKTWRKVTRKYQSPSITAIVQDPRPWKGHIWYYSTGERAGNSASGGNAFFTGVGIYKSTNYGLSWRLLRATKDEDLTAFDNPFEFANSLAIHPSTGDLYVGTYNGVHRSKDGGKSFEEVLPSDFDSWTEVMITPKGKIYATVDFFGGDNKGFFTSEDGDNWENITPQSVAFNGRSVMAYDPSNENNVYFLTQNLLSSTSPFLHKYELEKDSIIQNRWTDLSANLPTKIGGSVGNLNLQGKYNMLIRVKPDNPNFIVLGGTNLYRSTTGFTTPAGQESWIGGYSPLNDVSVYKDHHPDQHNFIFYPSNPNRALSANDGGVQVTEDINTSLSAEDPVDWVSLNNGYLTTQPYAFSFDPEAKSDDLVAGFQDNGSWYSNSTNSNHTWVEDYGGDGSFNAIADGGKTRYVSSQFSNIYRLNFDENGEAKSFARILPAISKNASFINPFVLDPLNDNIMYLPDGNRMLRNNNLDEIPTGTFGLATKNWVALKQTTISSGKITALDVSRYPVANRLYYGTDNGQIFKMDNANIDNQEVTDIFTGKGLPEGGYISNLTVDPSNSDRVIAVFSNYGIPSIFMTDDAGETWVDISSNLEENKDGSGNGPSVRWAAFFGNEQGIFVGTSTGLYYSPFPFYKNKTYWFKEHFVIGNAVVTQVKTRKDGFVGVASHGNGLFSGKFWISPWNKIPNNTLEVSYLLEDINVYENAAPLTVNVKDLFTSKSRYNDKIKIKVTNSNEDLVEATLEGDALKLKFKNGKRGEASVALIATNGWETVSEGFTITVEEEPIYKQTDEIVSESIAQNFTDFGALVQSADDFTVPTGNTWMLNRVRVSGVANNSPTFSSASVIIFKDDNGKPGEEVYNSGELVPVSKSDNANLNLLLPQAVELKEGSYWISVFANLPFGGSKHQWFWSTQANLNGVETHFKDDLDILGTGAVDWTKASTALNRTPADQVFQLYGVANDGVNSGVANESNQLANISAESIAMAWPNPSNDVFNFNLKSFGKGKISVDIYDINGRKVFAKDNIEMVKNFSWNASNMAKGIYLINIKGRSVNFKGKLIKN